MLQLGLEKHLDVLAGISSQASKEYALEKALKKMKADWENMMFQFVPYKESGVSILASFDDIQVNTTHCCYTLYICRYTLHTLMSFR